MNFVNWSAKACAMLGFAMYVCVPSTLSYSDEKKHPDTSVEVSIKEGELLSLDKNKRFYKYDANHNGVIHVKTLNELDAQSSVMVFEGVKRNELIQSVAPGKMQEFGLVFPCSKGESYYFLWHGPELKEGLQWEVKETAVPGILASDPIVISEGLYEAKHEYGTDVWYEFKADTDGLYKISSVGHTEVNTCLFVYGDDPQLSIASSNDVGKISQSEVEIELVKGEKILIKWSNVFSNEPYEWELSLMN